MRLARHVCRLFTLAVGNEIATFSFEALQAMRHFGYEDLRDAQFEFAHHGHSPSLHVVR